MLRERMTGMFDFSQECGHGGFEAQTKTVGGSSSFDISVDVENWQGSTIKHVRMRSVSSVQGTREGSLPWGTGARPQTGKVRWLPVSPAPNPWAPSFWGL